MLAGGDFGNPLQKFKLVFLGEQSDLSSMDVGNKEKLIKATSPVFHRMEDCREEDLITEDL